MILKIFTTLIITFLISCGGDDDLITFPPGDYLSDCIVSGEDSQQIEFTIAQNFRSQTMQTLTYTGVSNCSGEPIESEPETNSVSIVFSNVNLGDRFSYLISSFTNEAGDDTVEFTAFRFENRKLFLSFPVSDLGEDPEETFADFISNPAFNAEIALNLRGNPIMAQ